MSQSVVIKNVLFCVFVLSSMLSKAQVDPDLLVNIQSVEEADLPTLLPNAAIGSLIYNITDNGLEVRTATGWKPLETVSTIVSNADGNLVYTDEDGATTIIQQIDPLTAALTLEKETIEVTKRARVLVQPAADVNGGTFTITPSSFALNQTNATISGTSITGLKGNVRLIFQPYFTSAVQRANLNCVLRVNGADVERVAGTNYIRNISNHNSSSSNWVFEREGVSSTDSFEFVLEQEALNGVVQMLSSGVNNSYIFIEEYSNVEVVTNAIAPIDLSIAQGPVGPAGAQGPIGVQGPQGDPAAFEKLVIWAEESGSLSNNNTQWSYGNGAVGVIGIPLPEDWEAYAVSFNADANTVGSSVEMAVIDSETNTDLLTFTATGTTDNMVYVEVLSTPIAIAAGTSIGFRTINESGTVSDARVAVFLRRIPD